MGIALQTDLYELRMAASYLRRGMVDEATFSLYVRELPPRRGFLVAAGLDDCLAYLEGFRFDGDDLDHLGSELGFPEPDLARFAELRFTGDVWAVPEGGVVLANEPLLEVTAPIAEAQLVETYLLNQATFQTAIASKAVRCRIAAGGRDVVDFSFRRTHGPQAGISVARAAAIAGFAATSNVEAARRYGLSAAGTMAHSYIEAFASETDAFAAFADDFPTQTTFLVDTFDTPGGIRAAIEVAARRGMSRGVALRVDSGDLGELTRAARRSLDAAGMTEARIIASGGLDEHDIDALVRGGAPIDVFGVGTRVGVSWDHPSLDSAYKLVEYGGRPVLKLSAGKATAPGRKQVLRHPTWRDDIVALRHETADEYEPLLVPVMRGGRRTEPVADVAVIRSRVDRELALLPGSALDMEAPVPPPVRYSDELGELIASCVAEHRSHGSGADAARP